MQKKPNSESGAFNARILVALVLCSVAATLAMLSFAAPTPSPATAGPITRAPAAAADEADMPDRLMNGTDKATYLRLREEHIGLLRGVEPGMPFDFKARGKAIEILEQQESVRDATRSILSNLTSPTAPAAASPLPAWSPIGPDPIPNGQVVEVSGGTPVTGRIPAFAVDPTNPLNIYIGAAEGGVWRSTNGGTTWTPIFDSAQSQAIGALALAPSNPHILYVGTGEGSFSCDSYSGVGLYRIDNADTTATLVGPIDPPTSSGANSFGGRVITKILVHPTDPATIFVSTGSGIAGIGCNVMSGPPRGLYRSTNATAAASSVTFTKLTVTTAGSVPPDNTGDRDITDMVFEPGNPNNLTVWVQGTADACPTPPCPPNDIVPGDGGIYHTTNALAPVPSFTFRLTTTTDNARGSLAIVKDPASTVTVYAATGETVSAGTGSCSPQASTVIGAVRKSTDGGLTWSAPLVGGRGFCDGQCFYDITIAANPIDPNTAYLGGAAKLSGGLEQTCSNELMKTVDGFATVAGTVPSDAGLHADTHVTMIDPTAPDTIYFASDGGVWKSVDAGNNWIDLNTPGLGITQFQSVSLHPTLRNFSIGGTQDNGTNCLRNDAAPEWVRCDFGDGGYALIDQNATNETDPTMYHTYFNAPNALIAYAEEDPDPLSSSAPVDNGWNVRGCSGGPANGINCTDNVLFYAPMALGPGNPNAVYFGTDRLYRSDDRGVTHAVVSDAPIIPTGTRSGVLVGVQITSIGISPQDNSVRIVGMRNGKVFATTTGENVVDTGFVPPANPNGRSDRAFVSRAMIDPNNKNIAYITLAYYAPAGQAVWKTTNLNASTPTWTAAGNGIPSIPVNAFAINPKSPMICGSPGCDIFAGTDIGVYRSFDGGASWSPYGTGLPRVAVFDMAIQNSFQVLRIATHGRSMWEIPIQPVPIPTSAVSRKTHLTKPTPTNFDINLLPPAAGIEMRRNTGSDTALAPNAGRDHEVIVTFAVPVTVGGVTVTTNNAADTPSATFSVSSNVVTVDLHNIPDARRLNITLLSVSDGSVTGNVSVPMAILLGDVNASGRVDAADVSLVRQQTLQPVTSANFGEDINLSGRIDAADVSIVRQRTLTLLP